MSGYIVPDNPSPTERIVRLICVPPDALWQANIEGALSVLRQDYSWDNENGTAEAAAETADDIYFNFIGVTGDCVTELCSAVADCIENSPEVATALAQVILNNETVRNAIQQMLAETGYGSGEGTPSTPSIYNEDNPLLDGSLISGCDNDNLFGGVTQLVDLMNTIITDTFETIEANTEGAERWASVLEAIPVTNVLAIDDLIQFGDQLIENIGQSYAGEYTAQLRDEFRCDLFCLVKDTCELDFQVWADYFMGKLGEAIVENAFQNAIAWFTGGNFSNEEIVYAAHAILCQVFAYGSRWLSVDMAWFSKSVTAAMNDPDPDWSILCTDCATAWCWLSDGTEGWNTWRSGTRSAGWTASLVSGVWTKTQDPQLTFEVEIPTAIGSVLTGISLNHEMIRNSGSDNAAGWVWLDHDGAGNFNEVWRDNSLANAHGAQDDSNQSLNYTVQYGILSLAVNVAGGSHTYNVNSVTLRGDGVNPYGTSNCA